jgi:hypothetical protein
MTPTAARNPETCGTQLTAPGQGATVNELWNAYEPQLGSTKGIGDAGKRLLDLIAVNGPAFVTNVRLTGLPLNAKDRKRIAGAR